MNSFTGLSLESKCGCYFLLD